MTTSQQDVSRRDCTAQDWDDRVTRLTEKLPDTLRKAIEWLREPHRRWIRIGAALLFILGGIFSILPVLGLWMLPVGLALLSQDIPALKVPARTLGPLDRGRLAALVRLAEEQALIDDVDVVAINRKRARRTLHRAGVAAP